MADNSLIPKIASGEAMNAHGEAVKLLDHLREYVPFLPVKLRDDFESRADSLEVLMRAYMTPKAGVDWSDFDITPTERRFLDALNRNFGRTVTYDSLADSVYFDREMGDKKIMNVHTSKIRAKLLRREDCPYMIETDWGIGYKLVRKEDWRPPKDRSVRRTNSVYLKALRAA